MIIGRQSYELYNILWGSKDNSPILSRDHLQIVEYIDIDRASSLPSNKQATLIIMFF